MTATASPPAQAPSGRRFAYIPAIDGIRGFWVVIGPLLYHARPDVFPGGILGIDLFFVLSSYLIISIALDEWDRTGRIDLKAYAGRRARRLLPALFLALGGLTLYLVLLGEADATSRWTGAIVSTLTYSANWYEIVSNVSYFEQFQNPSPLRHVWSFAIEEQFYLFAPFFLVAVLSLFRRNAYRALLVFAVAGTALSAWWMGHLYAGGGDPSRVYYGTDTRAHALFVGIALAVAVHWWGPVRTLFMRRVLKVGAYAATGFFLVAIFELTERTAWMFEHGGFLLVALVSAVYVIGVAQPSTRPWHYFLSDRMAEPAVRFGLPVFYASLVVVGWAAVNTILLKAEPFNHGVLLVPCAALAAVYGLSNPTNGPLNWFLEADPTRWVGKISYGLYMYHWPVYLLVTPERAGALLPGDAPVEGNALVVVHLAITFAIATASFYLVERPVMARRLPIIDRPLRMPTATLAGGLAVVAILAGLLIVNARPGAKQAAAQLETEQCVTALRTGKETRIMVAGDSISAQIGQALGRWSCEHPGTITVFNESRIGCIIARYGDKRVGGEEGPVGDICSNWAEPADPPSSVSSTDVVSWATAIAEFDPDLVLVHITPWDVTDRRVPSLGNEWTHVGRPDFDEYVRSEYRAATDLLTSGGAELWWIEGAHLNQQIEEQNAPARIDRLNDLVHEAVDGRPNVNFVPYPSFLGEIDSPREKSLRPDGVHLSEDGLALVAGWLTKDVLTLEPAATG